MLNLNAPLFAMVSNADELDVFRVELAYHAPTPNKTQRRASKVYTDKSALAFLKNADIVSGMEFMIELQDGEYELLDEGDDLTVIDRVEAA